MKNKWKIILPVLLLCIAGGIFCIMEQPSSNVQIVAEEGERWPEGESSRALEDPSEEDGIWVYVCGHVQLPGVYRLDADARVFEAIEMAGGALSDAVESTLNLAAHLTDGQQIYVPGAEEEESLFEVALSEKDRKININTASLEELKTLPGIGDAKAEAIISYREHKPFQTVEEIMQVPGIKESVFSRIREKIRV